MARYKLLEEAVINDTVLAAGTEIGDGTPYPFDQEPGPHMEGLDREGKKKVEEVHQKLYGKHAPKHPPEAPGHVRVASPDTTKDDPGTRPKRPLSESLPTKDMGVGGKE